MNISIKETNIIYNIEINQEELDVLFLAIQDTQNNSHNRSFGAHSYLNNTAKQILEQLINRISKNHYLKT